MPTNMSIRIHRQQKLQRQLEKAGWVLRRTGGKHRNKGHLLFRTPSGEQVCIAMHGQHQLERLEHRYLARELRRDSRARQEG